MLCTGARFSSTCSGCPAQERDFERRTSKAIPETSAPYCPENHLERSTPKLVAGRSAIFIEFDVEDKSTKFRGCSARERDFSKYHDDQNAKTSNCLEQERNF